MNQFEPKWDDILSGATPASPEEIAKRQDPDNIADMSEKEFLPAGEQRIQHRVDAEREEIEKLRNSIREPKA